MIAPPTYQFYQETYQGGLSESQFNAALSDATVRVNLRIATRDTTNLPDDEVKAYQMAVCAVCDVVDEPAVSSYTVSKTSEEFVDSDQMSTDAIIDRYLSATQSQRLFYTWL